MVAQTPAIIVAFGGMSENVLRPLFEQAAREGYVPQLIRVPIGLCEVVTGQYADLAKPIDIELATAASDEVNENFALLWDSLHYVCFDDSCAVCYAAHLADQCPANQPRPKLHLVFGWHVWTEGRESGVRGTHLRRMLAHLFCTLSGTDEAQMHLYADNIGLQRPSQAAMPEPWYNTCRRFN